MEAILTFQEAEWKFETATFLPIKGFTKKSWDFWSFENRASLDK
jgi:hypothetical protein